MAADSNKPAAHARILFIGSPVFAAEWSVNPKPHSWVASDERPDAVSERLLMANSVEKLPQSPDAEFYLRFEAWSVSSI
jgi:hypothetical protein